jgi:tRNA pseudouridine32 synthase/23S rRNA pseudouridine746 synthase
MAMESYTPPIDPWIDVVFEDEHILVANKPSGLLSVPGRLEQHYDSLWSRLVEQYPDIQVVHRLDMATSGLMLFAKTKEAERHLKKQFQYRLTHKVYYARVWGKLEEVEGIIDLPLICDWPNRPRQKVCMQDGKPSTTDYQRVLVENKTTIVRLLPITGRSHQLRVHMMEIGHPIVGDEFYSSDEAQQYAEHLQLHSAELSFYHPATNKITKHFVPCDFYPEAESVVLAHYDAPIDLPDYKLLPKH